MIIRAVKKNPSALLDGVDSQRVSFELFMNRYRCLVNALSRSKVDFLCLLREYLQHDPSVIEKDGALWLPKTFDEWAAELCLTSRTINRLIVDLQRDDIILVKKLADHKSNRTNYYTINYLKLWELIPESKDLFAAFNLGEVA